MPLPMTTAMLVAALVDTQIHGKVFAILALAFVGLALANEALRAFVTRSASAQRAPGEYEIPARQRTPITYDEGPGT